jgi:hypothetical protein
VHTIWARFEGRTLAVATRKLQQNVTVLIWKTLEEVLALPLVARPPIDPVDPVDPKEPVVDVPNRFDLVQAVFNRGGHDLKTKDGCGRYTEACAAALYAVDPRFGHLKKRPGQNQVNGHAVDAVLFKATGQAVDIISDSESDQAKPAWGVDIPRYTAADWYAPSGVVIPPDDPPDDDEGALATEVARLRQAVVVMDANVLEQGRHLDEVLARVEALERKPGGGTFDPAQYQVTFPPGSATGSAYGHKHSVSLVGTLGKK